MRLFFNTSLGGDSTTNEPGLSELTIKNIITQSHSVVVFGIFGGKYQRDSYVGLNQCSQLFEAFCGILFSELFKVTLPEFRPFIRIVPEPFS